MKKKSKQAAAGITPAVHWNHWDRCHRRHGCWRCAGPCRRRTGPSGRGTSSQPGPDPCSRQRPDPHDGRAGTPSRAPCRSETAASSTVGNARSRLGPNTRVIDLKGRTVVPGLIEGHIHSVSLANRPGYHTILENTTSIREIQEALAARRKDVPRGPVDHLDGRLASEPVGRASPSDADRSSTRRFPTGRCCSTSGSPARASTNSLGKKFFDAADAAPPVHPDIEPVQRRRQRRRSRRPASPAAARRRARCSTCAGCRRSRTRSEARSTR